MNFGRKKILLRDFLEFVGNCIGMPMLSGNKVFGNSGCLKFGCTENSWEMLDQYYLDNCGQSWVMSLYPVVK